ncbi:sialate O-acetylesterase [Pontiellaceae bacterium B12227]|nr:sialate O-acetylesterase [Pontiellaceae bacterium B12227]
MKRLCGLMLLSGILAAMAFVPIPTSAALKVGSLFAEHMVLQRDMPVPVWGTADAGSKIIVEFAGQKKTTVADASNHWKITLDPLVGSFEPRTMTVLSSTGNEKSEISNVVVGEVWICSGQSNMQMGYGGIPKIKALGPTAKNLRTFEVKKTVAFTEQDSCQGAWAVNHPGSAVAFSFAYFLEAAAEVPVGIILTCWGSSSLEAWMPRDMAETVPHFKTMMEEFDADTEARTRIQGILDGPKPWSRQDDIFLRRQSNILYNAMLAPLAPYACRGLVWYQGERNAQTLLSLSGKQWFENHSGMLKYGDTLTQWMTRLRAAWNRDDFHFLVVMLPGYYKALPTGPQEGPESPVAHSWGWIRETQLQALELSNTSVANTIDLGDVKNIHPKDKLPVGKRLALLAQRDTLGMPVEAQGPVFQRLETKRGSLVVHFDHADGLKTTDGETPAGFWVADDSFNWVTAEATIKGKTVVLQSPELKKPLHVRYAFAGKPQVNLVNGAGLPAYPFRTDRAEP